MLSPTLTDRQLAKRYGRRTTGAVSLFEPFEWGYRCPAGHRGGLITWSEFNEHIWCQRCQLDYHSSTCPMQRQSWMDPKGFREFVSRLPFKPKILPGIDYYLEILDAELFIYRLEQATQACQEKAGELREQET